MMERGGEGAEVASADAELPQEEPPVALGDGLAEVGPVSRVLDVVAELMREARERILVVRSELVGIEVGGLARAGQPDTNEAWLVISEHHPVLHPGTLSLALRATGTTAHAVAVDRHGPAEAGAPREALPEPPAARKPFASAIPGEPHRGQGMARLVPVRARPVPVMPNWRLAASLPRMHP
jgi:hypothetical protein